MYKMTEMMPSVIVSHSPGPAKTAGRTAFFLPTKELPHRTLLPQTVLTTREWGHNPLSVLPATSPSYLN